MKYLLLLALIFPMTVEAAGAAHRSPWTELERQCEANFVDYEKLLENLRKQINGEISRMSQKQYTELDLKSDPRLIFIALSWPGDLSDKDEFWKANEDCAKVHWDARTALRSSATLPAEKKERVTDLKNCLLTRFNRTKVIAPFDQIISCYEKRASRK